MTETVILGDSPIEKSVKAFLKIHQLIEVGYGGNVTSEEWKDWRIYKYLIVPITSYYKGDDGEYHDILSKWKLHIIEDNAQESKTHIAFHTCKQAEEFLSYPENVKLVADYYMI